MEPIKDTYLYTSTDAAFYLVSLANQEKIAVNMTKVQKLLYITYSVFLRVYRERLLDEHPQAWPYGPVFPITRKRLTGKELTSISKNCIDSAELREQMEKDERLNKVLEFVF